MLTGKGVMSAAKKMANRQAVVLQNKKGKKGEDRNTEPEETDELDKDKEERDGRKMGMKMRRKMGMKMRRRRRR